MGVRAYAGISTYAVGDNFVIWTDEKSWPGGNVPATKKPPLLYCHGANGTAFKSADNVTESLLIKELALNYVVCSGDWGGDLFGNDAAMTMMNDALAYIRANWNASNVAPYLVGGSMGGCQVLNYALDNPVSAVAAVIPLTDLSGAWQQNLLSLTPYIEAAYGGSYNPETTGLLNDPITFAPSIDNAKPICLFPSSNDPILSNYTAQQFVWRRPATKYKSIGAVGHAGDSLGLGRAAIQAYLADPSGFVGDSVPSAPALQQVGILNGGNASTTSAAATLPTVSGGILKDDLIVVLVAISKSGSTGTTDIDVPGYKQIYDEQIIRSLIPSGLAAFAKVAAGGETSATVNSGTACVRTWQTRVFRGAAGIPYEVDPVTTSSLSETPSNTVNPARSGDIVLTLTGGRAGSTGSVAPVFGGGAVADYTTNSGRNAYLATATQTGVTGPVTHTVDLTTTDGAAITGVGSMVIRSVA